MKWIIQISLIFLVVCSCQHEEQTSQLFENLTGNHTGISFRNDLKESPDNNILEYLYFYNGSGVAVEDIDNDGLPDIYFGSNQKKDQLYLNLGAFKFKNVTNLLPPEALDGWTTGVNMVDINADGWMDIYVSRLSLRNGETNKLLINKQGKKFVEQSAKWGLDMSGYCTQSSFFDYDNDGDLDCYILKHSEKDSDQFKKSTIRENKDKKAGDLLLENIDGKFIDVTENANIYSSSIGFGLGISTADINNDGWIDIYVCNDFHEQDYLYLNNRDKTFTESISNSTGHTSNFSMGISIEDINNDAKMDIMTLDMKPFNDAIYKKSGGWENLQIYNYKRNFGYHHQSPRNALQINNTNDINSPSFSEQACYYGIEASDWSWTPLIADFDNDGDKDVYVSNGIIRRPNDMDFVNFEFDGRMNNKFEQIAKIPSGEVENVYYENDGMDKKFIRTFANEKTASTSAAFADLDLNGSIDIITNNINAEAGIIKNTRIKNNYLRIKLKGKESNINAVGAKVHLYSNDIKQTATINSSNGFLSHNEGIIHFGLEESMPDSILIHWSDGNIQKVTTQAQNTLLTIQQEDTIQKFAPDNKVSHNKIRQLKNYPSQKVNFKGQTKNKWLLFNENSTADKLIIQNEKLRIITSDGKIKGNVVDGNFIKKTKSVSVLPKIITNEIKDQQILLYSAADQNLDGINDYFIHTAKGSYIFISENKAYFKIEIGDERDIKAAAWGNIDEDKSLELVIAGLWMPIITINIDKESFTRYHIPNSNGWWLSLSLSDLDKDGNNDIIAGNFGINHSLNANTKFPIQAYENDFDRNGSTEKLITYFAEGREVPYPNQKLFVDQLPYAKKKFLKNEDYVMASLPVLLGAKKLENSKKYRITELRSCYFLNKENWQKYPLPTSLQISPLYSIENKNENYYFGGNLFDIDPNLGRQDAGTLQSYRFENDQWNNISKSISLPQIDGEIRSIKIHKNKIYIIDRNKGLFEYAL